MIRAEKVTAQGREWAKVQFPPIRKYVKAMETVPGVLYNPKSKFWAVPYENREEFEEKMGNFLIVWEDGRKPVGAGGIVESDISEQPVSPGYSVEYGEGEKVISSQGFKTSPWGKFQVRGFNALYQRRFLILADSAGLGKSWQVATAMEACKNDGLVNKGLIVCKASLIYNWRDEIHTHTHQKAIPIVGNLEQRCMLLSNLELVNDDWTFMIVSYEAFRDTVGGFNYFHKNVGFDFMVLDECHKVKNPNSKMGAAIHHIDTPRKYLITATPLPNTPLECYNYFKWGSFFKMNWWQFKKRHAIMGGYNNKEVIGYDNMKPLQNLFRDHMLRRLKEDKLEELPDVTFKTISITMSPPQQKLYDGVKNQIIEEIQETDLTPHSIRMALTRMLRLQQITGDPTIIGSDIASTKLKVLDDLLEDLVEEGKEKVIVFSRFRTIIESLEKRYAKYNPAVITGDVSASGKSRRGALRVLRNSGINISELSPTELEEKLERETTSSRQKEVYKFQEEKDCRIFLGTSSACREGLTLTAATHVVFIDCEWSPAYVEQAYSRAHRIGQSNAVTVYYLNCENTIDEYVHTTLKRKETMAQMMLEGSEEEILSMDNKRAKEVIKSLIGA